MEHGEDWTTWVAYIAIVALVAAWIPWNAQFQPHHTQHRLVSLAHTNFAQLCVFTTGGLYRLSPWQRPCRDGSRSEGTAKSDKPTSGQAMRYRPEGSGMISRTGVYDCP